MGSHSAWKCINAKFSLGSLSYQSQQLPLPFPSPGLTLRIFAEGDTALIHGIGRRSRNSQPVYHRCSTNRFDWFRCNSVNSPR
jgi:hypothetical protein